MSSLSTDGGSIYVGEVEGTSCDSGGGRGVQVGGWRYTHPSPPPEGALQAKEVREFSCSALHCPLESQYPRTCWRLKLSDTQLACKPG